MKLRYRSRLPYIGITAVILIMILAAGVGWSQEDDPAEGIEAEEVGEPVAELSYMDLYVGADADRTGTQACLMCHSAYRPGSAFTHVSYIELDPNNPDNGYSCEGCHGAGSKHMGNAAGIINPSMLDGDRLTDLCSKCHNDLRSFETQAWYMSEHYNADIFCLNCHSGHSENDYFLVNEDRLELCYTCHSEKRGEFNMRSHHPVGEDQMGCSDCHNPHSGYYESQLNTEGDELCFGCHGDKQGPFIYDHDMGMATGGDGCVTCHSVHGSNSDNLLKYPHNLCTQCHTDIVPSGHFPGTCWTSGCHSEIHGSNSHPLYFY